MRGTTASPPPERRRPCRRSQRAPSRPTAASFSAPAGSSRHLEGGGEGRPTMLVTKKLGAAGLELLWGSANVYCAYELTPEELRAKVSLVEVLVVHSATRVTREVFKAARITRGRLHVVGPAGIGTDNVDLHAATEAGFLVVNAPTANTVAAAEHAVALLAAMARNVAQADASLKAWTNMTPPHPGATVLDLRRLAEPRDGDLCPPACARMQIVR
ncbi:D-3-phosphoglycerate dehydrogenase 3, chloroplastic-like [Triticum aestivum]|uniref:D-3-phosphoglycerate dehydrogenase 3, chloroplastic-like n=1 Tax=Triticum aestivum TaxID=4565 RepID=UPI001D013760|nr:D-3-phosphoglycerate dehydrogenase 3, chloroplastic-like [Triticum aestivum]